MTATVKGAWITAAAGVLIAVLTVFLDQRSGHEAGNVAGNVGNTAVVIGSKQVVINQGSPNPPAKPEPAVARFHLDDPRLEIVRFYDFQPKDKQTLALGSCPSIPCFLVSMYGATLTPKPLVEIRIGGEWAGVSVPEGVIRLTLPLAKTCGFTFQTGEYDLLFEIIDDRASSLRAVLGALRGSGPESGFYLKESGCNPDA